MPNQFEKILYRILLGYYYIYVDDIKYKIIYPDLKIKYEAELLYEKAIEDNKYDKTYLNDNEIKLYLQRNNIWHPSDESKLKDCEKFLEDSKIDLYLNFSNTNNRSKIEKNIAKTKDDLEKLFNRKNSFNYLTINDQATSIKNEFILMHTIYDINNNLVFNYDDYDTFAYHKLQVFIREILENSIKYEELRLLCKSDLWKSYSITSSLDKDILFVNDDYRHLIHLHKMYENVRQHPECPSDDIINHDDALDGWFIHQNKKAEKEKKKNSILDKYGKNIKNAGEVFLLTSDSSEKKDIYDLNDLTTRQNIKEVINTGKSLKDNESLEWKNLGFVQRDIRQQVQQQPKSGAKRK